MPSSNLYDERALFVLVAEGDEAAFRRLFESYTPKLNAFFLKMTKDAGPARDLVQEVFLNIWLYRASLASVDNPSAYIYRIASNIAIAHFRKEDVQRKVLAGLSYDKPNQQNFDESLQITQLKEVQGLINEAVKKLPPQQQQVFRLSREDGLSRGEIALKLGLAEKTVRNHLTLSLRAIQQFLADHHAMYIPVFLLLSFIGHD